MVKGGGGGGVKKGAENWERMNKQCGNGKSLYSMSLWHFIYRYLLCSDVNLKIYYSTEVWW